MGKVDTTGQYKELVNRTERYALQVRGIFEKRLSEIIGICYNLPLPEDKIFKFADYDINKEVTEKLRQLYSEVYQEIRGDITKEWNYSNDNNDKLVKGIFGKQSIENNLFAKYFGRNKEAMNEFFARKTQGMDLSQRVWKYVGQAKEELELALDLGIGQGLSANELSKQVRQYLNEPDKLFRRVRDKHGNLQLSKAAKAYHPGQGVYRSSYKNAMRLTRTETNMAYRGADCLRWAQMDFITGYEVKKSNSHCIEDICDILAGKYPKGFIFKGWHPQCMCYMIPIVCTEKELDTLQDIILSGEDTSKFKPGNEIKQLPKNFRDWLADEEDKIKRAKKKPYFILDNYKNGDISKGAKFML